MYLTVVSKGEGVTDKPSHKKRTEARIIVYLRQKRFSVSSGVPLFNTVDIKDFDKIYIKNKSPSLVNNERTNRETYSTN